MATGGDLAARGLPLYRRDASRLVKALLGRSLAASSLGLAAGKIAQMGFGFLFWVVAARAASTEQVGAAGAVTSAVMLVTQISLFGFGAAVITHLPSAREPGRLVGLALCLVCALSVVVAAAMVALGSAGLSALRTVVGQAGLIALFVGACVAGSAGVLMDNVSMSQRRGRETHNAVRPFASAPVRPGPPGSTEGVDDEIEPQGPGSPENRPLDTADWH